MPSILLVDDVELFLQLEKSFLDGLGCTVRLARSGSEALAQIAEELPDLVLLDLYMHGCDGDEVCRRLRADERWRHLPVIMVTAAGRDEEIRRCLEAGCDDYLTKPISKPQLIEKVQRLLGMIRSRTAPRVPVTLRVQVEGNGRTLEACAQDISANGVYVKSPTPLEPGTAVELRLLLPAGGEVPVLGKVKRVRSGADGGMGIYFVHPEPEGVAALLALVAGSAPAAAPPALPAPAADAALADENRRLHARIEELERENLAFAEQLVETEQLNNNLTNLYIASTRLHSELRDERVRTIIKEVVINFVGAEKFALLLYDDARNVLRYAAGEGFAAGEFPELDAREAPWRGSVADGENWFQEGSVKAGTDDPLTPLAVIPLMIHGRCMGVLSIYRLLVQKDRFVPVDFQLFSMLAEHAATALFSASLYEASERKRQTYRGFMDLLLNK